MTASVYIKRLFLCCSTRLQWHYGYFIGPKVILQRDIADVLNRCEVWSDLSPSFVRFFSPGFLINIIHVFKLTSPLISRSPSPCICDCSLWGTRLSALGHLENRCNNFSSHFSTLTHSHHCLWTYACRHLN
jgi:hypothetical protein